MNIKELQERSEGNCELCAAKDAQQIYTVGPDAANRADQDILVCDKCLAQIEKKENLEAAHWQPLSSSMWSEVPAVQVVSWGMLNRLREESWAADLLDMMCLEDENLDWAKASGDHESSAEIDIHKDSNGHPLENGDSVVLIKSLDVKGSTVNARLGTVVKNIKLDPNSTDYIEGRIEGQSIMIKTMYVRKQGAQIIT